MSIIAFPNVKALLYWLIFIEISCYIYSTVVIHFILNDVIYEKYS